jgi:protein TonB
MTGTRKTDSGGLPVTPDQGRRGSVLVARRDEPPDTSAADLSNVVPFARPRRAGGQGAPPLTVAAVDRPLPIALPTPLATRVALVAGSLAIHGLILAGLWQPPRPLASIGIEAITVEAVLGGHSAAGLASTRGENEIQTAVSAVEDRPEEQQHEQARPATEAPQSIPVAAEETAPESVARPDQPPVQTTVAELPPQQEPVRPPESPTDRPAQVAGLETPPSEAPDALPPVTQAETADAVVLPEPERHKPTPPEVQNAAPQPTAPAKVKARERKRIAAPTAKKTSQQRRATASTAASGVGRGRSDASSNYPGRVSAHLARHKRYPAAARAAGSQGVATVSFSLDGSGRVTSVRLARGSGIAGIDQEVVAMVRRASPFPAPPDGRGRSFTVPVRFNLR